MKKEDECDHVYAPFEDGFTGRDSNVEECIYCGNKIVDVYTKDDDE